MGSFSLALWLADIDGYDIPKNANGQWELHADQDLLVWLDLPSNINELDAHIESNYPYTVKAGEEGIITFKVACHNKITYTSQLNFIAADDLTLGAVCNGLNLRNHTIGINNDTCRMFQWMEPGKHTYVHYPLYTSCANKYDVYTIRGGQSSVGYNVSFNITADGAPYQDHTDGYPGESAWWEEYDKAFKDSTWWKEYRKHTEELEMTPSSEEKILEDDEWQIDGDEARNENDAKPDDQELLDLLSIIMLTTLHT